MGDHRAHRAGVAVRFAAAVCLFTLAAGAARAQQAVPPGPPAPGNRDPLGEMRERQQREAQLRSAGMVGTVRTTDRRGAAAAAQMREDFKSIQLLRNKLARHLLSDKPLDYKFVAGEAGEINKRAGRLKSHLLPTPAADPKKEPEAAVEIADEQMRDALATMCKRIDSFTENPLFKVPDVVDLDQSAKANRDLRHIILLSEGIMKTAEKQNKTRGK